MAGGSEEAGAEPYDRMCQFVSSFHRAELMHKEGLAS
jgi:hypothetical protein